MPDLARAALALETMAGLLGIETKSIASVARKFHAELRNLCVLAWVGGNSILADLRNLIDTAIEDAYFEGLKEGGVTAEEMDNEDASRIATLQSQQSEFVRGFSDDVRKAKDDKASQRDILDNRVDLWTASIEAAGAAGLNSARANEMVVWRLGNTERHCKDCQKLDGQRHRRKWFDSRGLGAPGTPGQPTECSGYNCDCKLE